MNQHLKILYLEDDIEDIQQVKWLLEDAVANFDFCFATTGSDFVKALSEFSPDIILADDSLPDFDSVQALKISTENKTNAPFILLTGNTSEDFAAAMLKNGAFDYVHKTNILRLPNAIMKAIQFKNFEMERANFLKDIKANEALLKEAETLAHLGSWEVDLVTYVIKWSDEAYRLFGYEPGEAKPSYELFLKHIHPDDLAFVNKMTSDAMIASNKKIKFDFRIVDNQGVIKYIRSELSISKNNDGRPIRISGFNLDITESVISEHEKINRESFYKKIIEHSSDMKILMSEEGTIIYGSPVVTKILGFCPENYKGANGLKWIHPRELPAFINILKKVLLEPSGTLNSQQRIRRIDGSYLWCDVTISNHLKEPDINALVANFRDITDQINYQSKIIESEKQYRNLFENNPMPMWIADEDSLKFLDVNKAALEHYGYSKIEFLALSAIDIRPEEDIEKFLNDHKSKSNIKKTGINKHFLKDGSIIHVEIVTSEITYHGKKARLILSHDITGKLKAQSALEQSESNIRTIFQNTDTGFILLDCEMNIVSFNSITAHFSKAVLNKPLAEGSNFLSLVDQKIKPFAEQIRLRVLRGEIIENETNYSQSGANNKWFFVKYVPISNINGEINGILISIKDITERKTTELERERITSDLIRQNKELEQFAYIVSHNLRGPVANILGTAELLKENHLSTDEYNMLMNGLDHTVHKLDDVIHDLNYILQAKNPVNEKREFVEFSALLEDIKISIADKIESEQVRIFCDFSTAPGIMAVKSYLYSIFYNLISNSIKYRQHDICPYISITSKISDDSLLLSFKDNGIGMDMKSVNDQLFHLYKRFHFHTEGKGMGLYMVKTQVETLGGSISVLSEENKGTEFLITFNI